MVIDAHHHFWIYHAPDYPWIGPGMDALRRDFLPADLAPELRAAAVDAVITVQARQSLAETRWLLDLAAETPWMHGVVGWLPLADARIEALLEAWAPERRLVGLRHVVQDEPDPAFLQRPDFNRGVAALGRCGLAYDLLVQAHQLPETIAFVDRHPAQRFVLDHLGKPRIRDGAPASWRRALRELARRPHCFAKLSGLPAEADPARRAPADLQPYLDAALEAFGPERLMYGSDWPVCLPATGYGPWRAALQSLLARLSEAEQTLIFGEVARRFYTRPAA